MHSLEYQLEYAFKIAEREHEAIIGFFGPWIAIKNILPLYFMQGEFKHQFREFKSHSGAILKFYEVCGFDNLRDQICGTCFSHVFTRGDFGYIEQAMIRSRLRSNGEFTEPMGYYDEIGVHRYEGY